jgi:hypothetical protein
MRNGFVLIVAIMVLLVPISVCANASDNGGSNNDVSGSPDSGTSMSFSNLSKGDQIQDQDRLYNQTQDQIQDQDRLYNQTQDQIQDQNRLQNQTRVLNATELHDQIQERARELDRDQMNLSRDRQQLLNQYNNESAFVYILQNQSDQFGSIGPQLSQYAMQINTSIQVETQAQERIQSRNAVVRFFMGGDEVAAGELQQETLRNRQQIHEMQLLIEQCSCDPQVRLLLQNQLQQMEQQQTELQQRAQQELQDKGLLGWIWK